MCPTFFGRSSANPEAAAIQRFWAWWADAKGQFAAEFAAEDLRRLAPEMTRAVRAVHRELAWEVGPGVSAKHQLCVSGEGTLEQRALAGRVIRQAPLNDAEWEYYLPGSRSAILRSLSR